MLNSSIMELALMMTELMGGRLSIIQAWTAFGETLLASHMPPHELKEYVESTRAREHEAFRALTQSFRDRLADTTIEFVKGEAEDVIPKYVDAHEIDLVVMGTVARTGNCRSSDWKHGRAGATAPARLRSGDQAGRIHIACDC